MKKKYFLAALLTMLLFHTSPAQEVADPDAWFGVGIGLFSVDAGMIFPFLARLSVGYRYSF